MAEGFELGHEQRDGLRLIRWLGDPEIAGWKRDDLWGRGAPPFVSDYAMFGGAGLLYPALLGLFWRLTSGRARLALPTFDGVSICERAGRPYELVRWEYGIKWQQSDWVERDRGFEVAESFRATHSARSVHKSSYERVEGAALTPILSWPDLMSLIPVADQANTLCLFAIGPDQRARADLLAVLRADVPPTLESVMATDDDVFAVVTQEDEGLGLSSMLVAGRGTLRDVFDIEAARFTERVDAYLTDTAAAKTLDEWCAAVDRLAACPRRLD